MRNKCDTKSDNLLQKNWEELAVEGEANLYRMKVQATVAVSRLIGEVTGAQVQVICASFRESSFDTDPEIGFEQNLSQLQSSLKLVQIHSKKEKKIPHPLGCDGRTLHQEVRELISRMFRLIEYSAKINENIR